ncbi:hypothetical protein ABZS66_32405 [Dactylosporangium sp. NPDC005572]|uniref:hypothetical protein n=1 Tax=Dactylosporangium sp. NPDC005572 TaxID=3156889 RepID=UPI0033B328F0
MIMRFSARRRHLFEVGAPQVRRRVVATGCCRFVALSEGATAAFVAAELSASLEVPIVDGTPKEAAHRGDAVILRHLRDIRRIAEGV